MKRINELFNNQEISFEREFYQENVKIFKLNLILNRILKMKICQMQHFMIFKKVKIKYIIILDDPEYNSKNNISKEKTLDLSNNPIVFDEENLNNTSINTNDFSFYEKENIIEINEFHQKILKEYINKEKKYIDINHNLLKKTPLKDFEQLKFELKCLENNIDNYFIVPIMKNNIKYKKMNKCFENEDEDLTIKTSKKEKKIFVEESEGYETD